MIFFSKFYSQNKTLIGKLKQITLRNLDSLHKTISGDVTMSRHSAYLQLDFLSFQDTILGNLSSHKSLSFAEINLVKRKFFYHPNLPRYLYHYIYVFLSSLYVGNHTILFSHRTFLDER